MRTSNATALWNGNLAQGKGEFRAESEAFQGEYSAGTRFGDARGTNPEELLAAAHASCFSMALAHALAEGGTPPDLVETHAACTIEESDGGFAVTRMRLNVRGRVRGIDQDAFVRAAEGAKENCPISKALMGNLAIELEAKLEG